MYEHILYIIMYIYTGVYKPFLLGYLCAIDNENSLMVRHGETNLDKRCINRISNYVLPTSAEFPRQI